VTWEAPTIVPFSLKNGIKVLLVARHELPMVSVRVIARRGAGDVQGIRPGVMSFMGEMLEYGTKTRSAVQVAEDYDRIGAAHGSWVEWDSGGASVQVLSQYLDTALDILGDVVQAPSFPEAEVERLRERRIAALQQEKTSPPAMAYNAVAAAVYGRGHPYGHALIGREEDLKKVERAELERAYRRVFVPSNVSIVVAGDVTEADLRSKLEAHFGAWKGGAAPPKGNIPKAAAKGPRVVLVDMPGAPQSQVMLAEPGAGWSLPERDALLVMNTILGGMFSSRINLNLREQHAYTYGARSSFALRHGAGPFTAGGAIVAAHTTDAVQELLKEIKRLREEPVSPDELANAKESLRLAMPARFEAVGDVTRALSDLAVYDLPLDEYKTRPARIQAVTADDVKRVASAMLHPETMKLIIVGDRASIEPKVKELGLGPVETRDAFGDVK
jgi:predicted Zn-dependent peptidase